MKSRIDKFNGFFLILSFWIGTPFILKAQNSFITTWSTDDGTIIGIPTNPNYSYNYDVDWDNDGIFEDIGVTGDITHQYDTPNTTYQVAIRGIFPSIYFNNTGVFRFKIISIDQWGDIAWESMEKAFYGCSNLEYNAIDIPNLSAVTNMSLMFSGDTSLVDGNLVNWDVSNVTDMSGMFQYAVSFNGNLSNWNISSVTEMGAMLSNCGMSIGNYDNTLIGWASQNVQSNVNIGASGLSYCDGETARNMLINTHGWSFVGDMLDCTSICEATPMAASIEITSPTTAIATWDAIPGATNYQVWYRIKGTSNWTIRSSTSLQRNLPDLVKNKYYQYKVRANCSSGWSDFSDIEIFYTSLCSDIPTGIASIYLDNTRMRIRWDNTDEVKAKVRYREVGTSTWYTQNSQDGNNYIYINGLTPNATYQYRVRSNCSDNNWSAYSSSYFHDLSMPRMDVNELITTKIYPNPVNNILNIEFETVTEEEISIIISNQVGKVIHTLNPSYEAGIQRESIDVSSFANGYYFITIQGDDMMESLKFVKVK